MMEKENINNTIEEDLNRRNRNWDKISDMIDDVDGLISDVDGLISSVDDLINYVGDLETLTTDEKSTIVGALNEIDASYKTHKAESTSKHITESGTNTNGSYIKFDDGTMICTSEKVFNFNTTGAQHFPYPATFISTPVGNGSLDVASRIETSIITALSDVNIYMGTTFWGGRCLGATADGTVPIRLYAIGRWK